MTGAPWRVLWRSSFALGLMWGGVNFHLIAIFAEQGLDDAQVSIAYAVLTVAGSAVRTDERGWGLAGLSAPASGPCYLGPHAGPCAALVARTLFPGRAFSHSHSRDAA